MSLLHTHPGLNVRTLLQQLVIVVAKTSISYIINDSTTQLMLKPELDNIVVLHESPVSLIDHLLPDCKIKSAALATRISGTLVPSHRSQVIPHLSPPYLFLPATGSVSRFEASLCHGPFIAGTVAWRRRVTIGLPPKVALFTSWTPASGHSATRLVQPWSTRAPSRNSACCRCWWPWDSTFRKWD